MKFKRLPDKKVIKIIKQIEVEGMSFDATGGFYALLDELSDCDGFFTVITIDDSKLGEQLVKLGVAYRNVRGSYAPKNKTKLKELKHIICEVAYE